MSAIMVTCKIKVRGETVLITEFSEFALLSGLRALIGKLDQAFTQMSDDDAMNWNKVEIVVERNG